MEGVSLFLKLQDVNNFTEEMFNESPHHMIRLSSRLTEYVLIQNVSPHVSNQYDDTVAVYLKYCSRYKLLSPKVLIDYLKDYLTSLDQSGR